MAIVTVWLFMFGRTGLVNTVLGSLAPDPSWLINSYWAMPMIAIFVTWKQLGFFILLYLAALQNVPARSMKPPMWTERALSTFWSVTVPGVRPATTLVVILATITGMNLFTEPYLLTNGGGPNGASVTPVFYMYQKGVEQGQAGVCGGHRHDSASYHAAHRADPAATARAGLRRHDEHTGADLVGEHSDPASRG